MDVDFSPSIVQTAVSGESKSLYNHMNSEDWGVAPKISPFVDRKGGSVSPGSMLKAMQQTRFEMTQLSEETGSEENNRKVKVRV